MKNKKDKEHEFVKRLLGLWTYKSIYLSIEQTPSQKQMKTEERKKFRALAKAKVDHPFDGDICIIFHFKSVSQNPPRVDKLVKNYMDLMHKPDTCDNLKEIVFHDDSQVRYIHVNHFESAQYNKNESNDKPNVRITIMPFSFFRHMLYCIDKFCERPVPEYCDFETSSLERAVRDLQVAQGVKSISNDAIASAEIVDAWNWQESILKCLKKNIFDILPFFKIHQNDKYATWMKSECEEFDLFEKFYLKCLGAFLFKIPNVPQKHGETDTFIKTIRRRLLAFDSKILGFKQIRIPVVIQFIYIPPTNSSFSKDVDNIALMVIPEIMECFAFPKKVQKEDDVLPHNRGVTEYEIIQLPANHRYPEGCLFFSFTDKKSFRSMWVDGKNILEQQVVDRLF